MVEISAADALTCGNHHQIFLHNLQIVETVIRINPTGIVKGGQPENFQRREIVLQGCTVIGSDVMDGRQKIMVGRKIQEQLGGGESETSLNRLKKNAREIRDAAASMTASFPVKTDASVVHSDATGA